MMTAGPSLLALAIAFAHQGACLDATPGTPATDVGDGDVAGPDDTDAAVPSCATRGAELELITRDPGAFALGPCGTLAYWSERSQRELRFLTATHDLVTAHADPNGYAGTIAFSPSGRRIVASSLRSDLGFGDALVARFPDRAPLTIEQTIDFGADVMLVDDRPLLAGSTLFYLSGSPGATLYALDLDDDGAAPRALTVLDRAWLAGSTVRTRDSFTVSGDGSRVVVISVCESYTNTPCPETVRHIIDTGDGATLLSPSRWLSPLVRTGPTIAATTDQGAVFLDAAGVTHEAIGHAPAALMSDHLLTTRDGTLFALVDDTEPTPLVPGFDGFATSTDGHAAAIRSASPNVSPTPSSTLSLWIAHQLVPADPTLAVAHLVSVFADGHTLATTDRDTVLIAPDGTLVERWPTPCARNTRRVGDTLFFELCDSPNDELHGFDVATRSDRVVAVGHDFDYQVDPSGTHIAFTFLPLSATSRELHAGRIAP